MTCAGSYQEQLSMSSLILMANCNPHSESANKILAPYANDLPIIILEADFSSFNWPLRTKWEVTLIACYV
jgi:hypothetical protein